MGLGTRLSSLVSKFIKWQVLVQSLLINAGVSLFLLQKSMRPVISGEEIQLVWNKVGRWPMLLLN